ncbi:MAG: sigma-70 family RNA polymerase sigma factor [Oscillospiraceae bacterium]|nr:sigma-70 family RNA polymerase sigma factor [Oscillospiraceae bacterium]
MSCLDEQSDRPVDWAQETVLRNENKMFRSALAITGNRADAEDAVQDAFVKLFEKRPSFESSEHETAWLIRVTVNICKNLLRSPWRSKTAPLSDSYPARNEEQSDVLQAVLSLPAKYRAVIHLHYYEGYSTKEVAALTKQKESATREQLTRARRMLKKYLEGE